MWFQSKSVRIRIQSCSGNDYILTGVHNIPSHGVNIGVYNELCARSLSFRGVIAEPITSSLIWKTPQNSDSLPIAFSIGRLQGIDTFSIPFDYLPPNLHSILICTRRGSRASRAFGDTKEGGLEREGTLRHRPIRAQLIGRRELRRSFGQKAPPPPRRGGS